MPQQLGNEDAEFRRYCKFFVLRTCQIIVQARSGQSSKASSTISSSNRDWFNLAVKEIQEVNAEVRSSLENRYIPDITSLCLDISLRTAEGETLFLENWAISFDPSLIDPHTNVKSSLYHRMGTLLRSVLVATRVTPTFKYYAKKQGRDSFVLCYRVYPGDPDLDVLGDERRQIPLGYVACAYGGIRITLTYRTKMEIQNASRRNSEEAIVQGNECYYEAYPKEVRQRTDSIGSVTSAESPCMTSFSTSPPIIDFIRHQQQLGITAAPTAPSSVPQHLQAAGQSSGESSEQSREFGTSGSAGNIPRHGSYPMFQLELSDTEQQQQTKSPLKTTSVTVITPSYSNLPPARFQADFPFAQLLSASISEPIIPGTRARRFSDVCPMKTRQQSEVLKETKEEENYGNGNGNGATISASSTNQKLEELGTEVELRKPPETERASKALNTSQASDSSEEDGFVKIHMQPAFVAEDSTSDLSQFIQQCKAAPGPEKLHSFTVDEHLDNLSNQLAQFQTQLQNFDSFVHQLKEENGNEEEEA